MITKATTNDNESEEKLATIDTQVTVEDDSTLQKSTVTDTVDETDNRVNNISPNSD